MKLGMQTMEQSLAAWVNQGTISMEEALAKSSKPDELYRLTTGGASGKTKPKAQQARR